MAVAIPPAALDTVDSLSWLGGGHATAHMVWQQWDGESDEFRIRSLAGVEALRNLRDLKVTPLALLPEHQIAQLRARGITVSEWDWSSGGAPSSVRIGDHRDHRDRPLRPCGA